MTSITGEVQELTKTLANLRLRATTGEGDTLSMEVVYRTYLFWRVQQAQEKDDPWTTGGADAIWFIVDRLTKSAYFLAIKK
ncbi:unnamed protein product [Cochlearia groenlandica]